MSDPVLPPYVLWRNGRPRFHPSSREVALGFCGRDLKHAGGRWFSFEEACKEGWPLFAQILECRGFNEHQIPLIVEAHKAGKTIPRLKPVNRKRRLNQRPEAALPAKGARTLEALLGDWLGALDGETDADEKLSPDTIDSYRKAANAVIYKPQSRSEAKARRAREQAAELIGATIEERAKEEIALEDVDVIDRIAIKEFFRAARAERGAHMAHGMVAAISAAWTWGMDNRKWRLGPNPRHGLELARPDGRIVIYSDAEIRALRAAAEHIKVGPGNLPRRSIAISLVLGLFTCQRQRDRLLLKDEGLLDGRRMIRQSKTRKLVAVKETPMLIEALDAARAHNAAIALAFGQTSATRAPTITVNEATGKPYTDNEYRNAFEAVRKLALEGIYDVKATELERLTRNDWQPVWILPPCPSLKHCFEDGRETLKQDRDLRDTSITWLARAGCTMAEICAISGHSPASVETIIRHYLGAHRELADAGIDKLTHWMQQEGIAV